MVVAALADSPVAALESLDDPGVTVAIGNPNVPVGAYARDALSLVGDAFAIRAMENVVTNEGDARGIVGKLNLGVVDAGILYRTDVRLIDRPVRTIPFAPEDQPGVLYAAAVVTDPPAGAGAREFLEELTGDPGARALAAYGFSSP